ncbi:FkbM family methyltransferase [Bradyrhizobium sp. AZCC 1588]|uniref:FkbM family methyltransferase n=1 Tax=unclassified Bradyrhizobium TaxID=2631580 RepID=UPI002FEFF0E5
MKSLLKTFIEKAGYEIRRKQPSLPLQVLEMLAEQRNDPTRDKSETRFFRYALENLSISKSQIFQDLFVLQTLEEKRNGYFVEFGAADGDFLSNTVLLERNYGWRGIVAEPGRNSHERLKNNRRCIIDLRCVWTETGKTLTFSENPEPELSTIASFRPHADQAQSREYAVETVSLDNLLEQHKAPELIDYLSIDTEGSELQILRAFNFSRRKFKIITVEHNYRAFRDDIFRLLTSKGYQRVLERLTMFDDWYVLNDHS